MLTLFDFLLYANYLLLFINVIIGFGKYRYFTKKERFYVFYMLFFFLIEMTVWLLSSGFGFTDIFFLYPIYIVGDFILLTSLFISKLNLNKVFNYISGVLALSFLSLVYVFKIDFNHDIAKVISNIMIICLAGTVLIMQIRNGRNIERFFFADLGMFFYYSVSIFRFIVLSQLKTMTVEDINFINIFNAFFAAVLYGLITYSFLKLKK